LEFLAEFAIGTEVIRSTVGGKESAVDAERGLRILRARDVNVLRKGEKGISKGRGERG
jgi:hypothetical protein